MSGCKIIVIAHGKSEMILCGKLRKDLRVDIIIVSNDNGEKSIKIPDAMKILSERPFLNVTQLHKTYSNLEYESEKDDKMPRLRIFPIMDLKDNPRESKSFKTKDIFKYCPLCDKIYPIWNDGELDDAMDSIGYQINRSKKRESYEGITDSMDVDEFYELLKEANNTNLDEFVEYCLRFSK